MINMFSYNRSSFQFSTHQPPLDLHHIPFPNWTPTQFHLDSAHLFSRRRRWRTRPQEPPTILVFNFILILIPVLVLVFVLVLSPRLSSPKIVFRLGRKCMHTQLNLVPFIVLGGQLIAFKCSVVFEQAATDRCLLCVGR